MGLYRFYNLDSDGHFFGPPAVADFPNDQAAIEAAEALVNGKDIEVWDRNRVVILLPSKRPE